MDLEQALIEKIESLGKISWKRMFGMQAILIDGKLMGGYKKIDENVLYLMLILSKKGFEEALDSGYFSKFDFGNTWVESELTSEEDLQRSTETLIDSFSFVKSKEKKKKK